MYVLKTDTWFKLKYRYTINYKHTNTMGFFLYYIFPLLLILDMETRSSQHSQSVCLKFKSSINN